MKLFSMILSVAVIVFAIAGNVSAVIIPNPRVGFLDEDLNDSGYFVHTDRAIAIEIVDPIDTSAHGGVIFGFFFEGVDVTDPSKLITIFDSDDKGPVRQTVVIDFTENRVVDSDDGGVLQSAFTGSGRIGFFLDPGPAFDTIFTVPS